MPSPASSTSSSLPSLIIEPELPKECDESDDFYENLLQTILRLYPHSYVSDTGEDETHRRSDQMDFTDPIENVVRFDPTEEIMGDVSVRDMSIDLDNHGGIQSMDRDLEDPSSSQPDEREIEVMRTPRIQRRSTGGTIEQHSLRQSDEVPMPPKRSLEAQTESDPSRSNIEPRIDCDLPFTSTPTQSTSNEVNSSNGHNNDASNGRSSNENSDYNEHFFPRNRNSDETCVLEGRNSDDEGSVNSGDSNEGVSNNSNSSDGHHDDENNGNSESDGRSSNENSDYNEHFSPRNRNSDETCVLEGRNSDKEDSVNSGDSNDCTSNNNESSRPANNSDANGVCSNEPDETPSNDARNSNEISRHETDENLSGNSNINGSASVRNSDENVSPEEEIEDGNSEGNSASTENNLRNVNTADEILEAGRNRDRIASSFPSRDLAELSGKRKRNMPATSAASPKKKKNADAAVQTDFKKNLRYKISLLEPIFYEHTILDE